MMRRTWGAKGRGMLLHWVLQKRSEPAQIHCKSGSTCRWGKKDLKGLKESRARVEEGWTGS